MVTYMVTIYNYMDVTITIITPLIVVLCAKYVYHVLLHCVSHCVVFIFCCNPAWIHIKCDCIHQHLPGSVVVWLSMFNLLKCTLAFFFPWHWESENWLWADIMFEHQTSIDTGIFISSCLINGMTLQLLNCCCCLLGFFFNLSLLK